MVTMSEHNWFWSDEHRAFVITWSASSTDCPPPEYSLSERAAFHAAVNEDERQRLARVRAQAAVIAAFDGYDGG